MFEQSIQTHLELSLQNFRMGATRPAYLFRRVWNMEEGAMEDRDMATGLYTVSDVHCIGCNMLCGFKYVSDHPAQSSGGLSWVTPSHLIRFIVKGNMAALSCFTLKFDTQFCHAIFKMHSQIVQEAISKGSPNPGFACKFHWSLPSSQLHDCSQLWGGI